ncbi:glycosyltransferase family 61 protein [Labrys sp. 22185]|uniref:glycosyltransferase family 61 protein n=1 Tax=Labrys sp. 22185 TaxID=3453888 RepID=UPI003F8246A1
MGKGESTMLGATKISELHECTGVLFGDRVHRGLPQVEYLSEVIYTPCRLDGKWGMFHRDAVPVNVAIDFAGQNDELIQQIPLLDIEPAAAPYRGRSDLIYGGRASTHYGHFLFETLPRLWLVAQEGLRGRKVLFHSWFPLESWHRYPYLLPCLQALGISYGDIVVATEPEVFRHVLVPRPSMQINGWIFPDAARPLMDTVGRELLRGVETQHTSTPAYISKAQLRNVASGIRNEAEIEQYLRADGVDIVYPETMSLAEQIALFTNRRVIMGALGSAFHTSMFAQPSARMVVLCPNNDVNSNFKLTDRAGGNQAEYYHSPDIVSVARTSESNHNQYCVNPRAMALALLRKAG